MILIKALKLKHKPKTTQLLDQISTWAQPDLNAPTADDDNDNDNETIHTNNEDNPIVRITILETAINYGANQIIISKVLHSTTDFKPIDVISGHISPNDSFNLKLDQLLKTDYDTDHRDKTKLLYSKIIENLIKKRKKYNKYMLKIMYVKKLETNLIHPHN